MLGVPNLDAAKQTLLEQLREHSLVLGEVTLSSGATAQYYVDARRTLMRPAGFLAAGELISAAAVEAGARQGGALDTRLIDLPRHQIARMLDDAMASVSQATRPGDS